MHRCVSCLISKLGQSCPRSRAIVHMRTMWFDVVVRQAAAHAAHHQACQAVSVAACIVQMAHLDNGVSELHISLVPRCSV